MKRHLSILAAAVLFLSLFTFPQTAFAETVLPDTLVGIKTVSLSSSPAYYKGTHLMLPAIEAAQAIGYYGYYNEENKFYQIYDKYGRYATIFAGYNTYTSNEYSFKVLSAASELKDGKLYVPVDLFSTLLMFDVSADGGTLTFTDNTTYNIVKISNPRLLRSDISYKDNGITRMEVIANEGYSALYPENTMLAFRKAIEIGVDELKADVRLSKDGVPVLICDETVDRTAKGKTGNVADMTVAELKELDVGSWMSEYFADERIPTLEELFEYCKTFPGLLINLEIRSNDKPTVDAVNALVEQYGMKEKILLTSWDGAILDYAFTTYGYLTQGYTPGNMENFVDGENGTMSKMQYILIDDSIVDGEVIYPYFDDGYIPYTFNADDMDQVKEHMNSGSIGLICTDPSNAIIWLRAIKLR